MKKEMSFTANKPLTAVWEITMGCNMRCQHCGSSCSSPLPGELSTEEALRLCAQIGELGLQWVTLSGGEPTTRSDWPLLAAELRRHGVVPNMISNGWLFNETILEQLVKAPIGTIAFSIDGLRETHDSIRREGSFDRIMRAYEACSRSGLDVAAITTINKRNLGELPELKQQLIQRGVKTWQVQMGFPMGNMAKHRDMLLEPGDIDKIIDFAYGCMLEGLIEVIPSDCIGYYNLKGIALAKKRCGTDTYPWQGCTAGKYTFGILHNGDILGCTSIRDREFIEGNIRETPLKEIWQDPDKFSWNRKMSKESLSGFCQKCRFGDQCLGGCANAKLTTGGSVYAENRYCSYNHANKVRIEQFDGLSTEELLRKGYKWAEDGYSQLAESALYVAMQRPETKDDIEVLNLYGYASFKLGNYQLALEANEKALQIDPEAVYPLKGQGLCLYCLDRAEEGIASLRKAVALTDVNFMDPYWDLAVVLKELGRNDEAAAVLEEGRKLNPSFALEWKHGDGSFASYRPIPTEKLQIVKGD